MSPHLYIGEEAVAACVSFFLERDDYIVSNHRGHGHCLAKGAAMDRMLAEIMGKETGYCRGRGGSMHIADVTLGNLGANGIVGAGLPIAVGAAFSISYRGTSQISVCYFGDAATNQGTFHEAVNLAAAMQLPVLFVCENNQYGLSTHIARTCPTDCVSDKAHGYGIEHATVDGMDTEASLRRRESRRGLRPRRATTLPGGVRHLPVPRPRGERQPLVPHARGRGAVEEAVAGRGVPRPAPRRLRPPGSRGRVGREGGRGRARARARLRREEPRARSRRSLRGHLRPEPDGGPRGDGGRREDDLPGRDPPRAARGAAAGRAGVRDRRGRRQVRRRHGRHQGPVRRVRREAPGRHPDLGVGHRRRRPRRRPHRPRARGRDHVHRLHGRLHGPDRQPGRQGALHARRPGRGAAGDPHAGRRGQGLRGPALPEPRGVVLPRPGPDRGHARHPARRAGAAEVRHPRAEPRALHRAQGALQHARARCPRPRS